MEMFSVERAYYSHFKVFFLLFYMTWHKKTSLKHEQTRPYKERFHFPPAQKLFFSRGWLGGNKGWENYLLQNDILIPAFYTQGGREVEKDNMKIEINGFSSSLLL